MYISIINIINQFFKKNLGVPNCYFDPGLAKLKSSTVYLP